MIKRYICTNMQEVKFLEDNKYTDNKITDYLFYYFEKEFYC